MPNEFKQVQWWNHHLPFPAYMLIFSYSYSWQILLWFLLPPTQKSVLIPERNLRNAELAQVIQTPVKGAILHKGKEHGDTTLRIKGPHLCFPQTGQRHCMHSSYHLAPGHSPLHWLPVGQEWSEACDALKGQCAKAPVIHCHRILLLFQQFWSLRQFTQV